MSIDGAPNSTRALFANIRDRLSLRIRSFVRRRQVVKAAIADGRLAALFDARWYLRCNPDVAAAGVDPWRHFIRHGVYEQRDAHPLLDVAGYLEAYPDIQGSALGAIVHYIEYGWREGRWPNPYFDGEWYSRAYLARLGEQIPLIHYIQLGSSQGLRPNPFFDEAWYRRRHDVQGRSGLEHFIVEGAPAGATPNPLWRDAKYRQMNPDLADHFTNKVFDSGFAHFVRYGAQDLDEVNLRRFNFTWGARSLDFDGLAYRATNPDVAAAISQGRFRNAAEHFFTQGLPEALAGMRTIYGPEVVPKLRRDLHGERPAGGAYLCLFAHYDRDGVVDNHVLTYLSALGREGVDIVFITAADDPEQLAKVAPLTRRILVKTEAGRDFGSWWLALKTLGLDLGNDYRRVMFLNDSIYCPIRPLAAVINDMEQKAYNLYGLSDSRDVAQYHIQSFFLAFDEAAQRDVFPVFVEIFERNFYLGKSGQIQEYELGLTAIAQQAGLSVGAFFSIDDAREDLIRDSTLEKWGDKVRYGVGHINPTHNLWDIIVLKYGWPGLKVDLLRRSSKSGGEIETISEVVKDVEGQVKLADIKRHQKRLRKTPSFPPGRLGAWDRRERPPAEVQLLRRIEGGGIRDHARLVLFAHYDPQGMVDDHIAFQVKALAQTGCAVAFITPVSEPAELAKIEPHVRDILVKNDTGRDFGSWALALRELGEELQGFEWVIWMNDSTYFPLFDPAAMFEEMERRGCDFWGVVDSRNVTWHLMSWFWAFNRRAISAGWFNWYLNEYRSTHTKWAQIHNYEMRVPRLIRASGLKADAFIRVEDVQALVRKKGPQYARSDLARRGEFTMTHHFWDEIITEFRCPALKVELVRDNPLNLDLSRLLDVIETHTDYDPGLIRRHMMRLKTGHLMPPSAAELGLGDG